jgi:hypothetical protein
VSEAAAIKTLMKDLTASDPMSFPQKGKRLDAPTMGGVYIIYSPSGIVVHVGRTPSGKGGIRQRLNDHLHNSSSFTRKYLGGKGAKLRRGYTFRALVVGNPRKRALLEYLAIGLLCPRHVGVGKRKLPET